MWKTLFLSACFLLGTVSALKADPIPMSPELKNFLMRQDQKDAAIAAMVTQWRSIVDDCPSPRLTQTNVIVHTPPSFSSDGAPVSGVWRMVGQFEGCNQQRLLSLLYAVGRDGNMVRFSLLPGTSATDPVLAKDAMMYAVIGMTDIAPKGCKDIKITNTAFVQFGEESPQAIAGRSKRSWDEEWTVKACGVTGIVPMKFVPDATGTAISSSVSGTRRISP